MKIYLPIFIIAIIFLPIYSVSASRDYGSTGGTDWNKLCLYVQPVLYKSCNEYVDNNGDLTSEGEKAYHCIRNGVLLGGGALLGGTLSGEGALGSSILSGIIIKGLKVLAEPTGCDGIVNFDALGNLDLPFISNLFK